MIYQHLELNISAEFLKRYGRYFIYKRNTQNSVAK